MELEKWAEALAVRVHRAHHEYDEMDKKRGPAHHKHSEKNGEGQGPSHAVAPPAATPPPLPSIIGESGNFLGMYAGQQEHVDVDQVDDNQWDNEKDNKAGHDDVGIKKPDHQHCRDAACCPDGTQDGTGAPHSHDVVVSKGVENGDITAM